MKHTRGIQLSVPVLLLALVLWSGTAPAMLEPPSVAIEKYVVVGETDYPADSPEAGPIVLSGSPVTFKFAVTNNGGLPLSGITLSDSVYGDISVSPAWPTTLEPGVTETRTLDKSADTGQHTDTATVTAIWYGDMTVTAQDSANYFGASPTIQVTKSVSVDGGISYADANGEPYPVAVAGTNVIFKFQVHNSGNVDLTNVSVTDPPYGTIMTLAALAAGADSDEYFYDDAVALLGLQTDTATAVGYWNGTSSTAADSAAYVGVRPGNIKIVKWVKVEDGDWVSEAPWPQTGVGVPVQYKLQVTNTGGMTLSNIVLQDQLGSDAPFPVSSPESLAPDDSFTVEFTDSGHPVTLASNYGEDLTNTTDTATVSAVWTDSANAAHSVTASASAAYFGVNPVVALKKYVLTSSDGENYTQDWDADTATDAPRLLVGTRVKYRFVLTNPGNVIFTDIVLHDSVPAHDADLQVQLAAAPKPVPGGSPSTAEPLVLEIGPYEVLQGLKTDVAEATGYFGDLPSNTSQDEANYNGIAPKLTIEKQISADGINWGSSVSVVQGSVVQFQFVVTNAGNDCDLANVLVSDLALGFTGTINALPKGNSVTLSAPNHRDTSNDPTNTPIENTATATATYTDDAGATTTLAPSSTASYTVTPVQVSLTVKKQVRVDNCGTWEIYDGDVATGSVPYALAGRQVQFRFTITNPDTSTVPVTVASLVDVPNLGAIDIALPQTLAPGTSVTGDSTPITVTDASRDILSDTVTANAYWVDSSLRQHPLDASDTAAYFPAIPKIQVTKQVSADGGKTWNDATDVTVGGSVLFRFIVTNTGNVTLSNIQLTDSPFDIVTGAIPEVQCQKCGWHYTWRSHCGVQKDEPDVRCRKCGQSCSWKSPHENGACGGVEVKCAKSECGYQDSWRSHDEKNDCSGPQIRCPKCGRTCNWASPYDTGSTSIPGELAPGASFSCTAGPFPAEYGFHEDTATAKGDFLGVNCGVTVTATDKASYTGILAMFTYTKGGYANNGAPGKLLNKYFSTAFRCGLEVGDYNSGGQQGHGLLWQGTTTGLTNLKSFLLGGGPSGPITRDCLNPGASCEAGGTLAKQVATLTINIGLGKIQGTGVPGGLGALHYCHEGDSLNGKMVSDILAIANEALARNILPAGYDFGSLNALVTSLNEAFDNGVATSWAVSHLQPYSTTLKHGPRSQGRLGNEALVVLLGHRAALANVDNVERG